MIVLYKYPKEEDYLVFLLNHITRYWNADV